MPSISVSMPYTGAVISVNHHKWDGGRYTLPETKAWMKGLTLLVRTETNRRGLKPHAPVTIAVKGFFRDGRSVLDIHNSFKILADAIEDAWIRPDGRGPLINDREFSFVSLGYEIDAKKPRLEITIEWEEKSDD